MEVKTQPPELEARGTLTPEYAAHLLYHSFRHSQGSPNLQERIFNYVHFTRPEWRIAPKDKPTIRRLSGKLISKYLGEDNHKKGVMLHSPVKDYDLDRNLDAGIDDMEKTFNGIHSFHREKGDLVSAITGDVIFHDLKFLELKTGRPRIPGSSEKPAMDPWLSFIVHFGLNRNPTGVTEFDEMYGEVRKVLFDPPVEERVYQDWSPSYQKVLEIYQEKHPGAPIDLNP